MQWIYGHRGASGYAPENTLEAFELAARMGAKFVLGVDAHEPDDLLQGREYAEAYAYAEKYSIDLLDRLPLKKVSD